MVTMPNRTRIVVLALTMALAMAATSSSRADSLRYSIVDLGVQPGTTKSIATSVNASGQVGIVSYNSYDSLDEVYDGAAKSLLYDHGVTTVIQPIGGQVDSINDAAQAVGGRFRSINNLGDYVGIPIPEDRRSILVSNGNSTSLGFIPRTITDSGAIGGHVLSTFGHNAVVLQNGQLQDIHAILRNSGTRYQSSSIIDINNSGDLLADVVPFVSLVPDTAIFHDGKFHTLSQASGGAGPKLGKAINNLGQVVGDDFYYTGSKFIIGPDGLPDIEFGQFYDLANLLPQDAGWSRLVALDINDAGQIVGQGVINGEERAFLMNPATVPEPASLLVFALVATGFVVSHPLRLQRKMAGLFCS